ncbi:proteasome accessory factor PafA2 family protein, partial [Corynebacterium xerosis]
FSDLKLREPVSDVQRVSRDLACTQKLQLNDHVTHLTAIEIQRRYLERVAPYATDDGGREIVALWGEVLDLLETDPLSTAHLLDWTAKLKLMEGLRQRAGIGWDHPKLALIDIQYSDIDPARGLYHALVRRGAMTTIADDAEVERAVTHAPESTRAYLRGGLLRRFSDDVVAASWDSAIVDVGDEVVKLTISDVSGLGAGAVGKLLEEAPDIASLVAGLRDRGLAGLS